ncbi:MAG: CHAT domain-containing protein [Scytonematopsis contorta HA4267-MV1]|jgi:CHAT domain-containing protein|nr:CHAT domain-containing protein [Scytonematopsis contorta HA4267-MV1]
MIKRNPGRKNFPFHRRLLLLVLLFIFSMAIFSCELLITQPPVIAQVQAGKASYEAGKFEQAARELTTAISHFAAKGDKLSQAVASRNLSLVYQQLGQWQDASRVISQSLAILRSIPKNHNQKKLLAEALDVQGRLLRETGKAADAQVAWEEASDLYQQIGNRVLSTQSLINKAAALQDLGLYPKACDALRSALGLTIQTRAKDSRRQQCNLSDGELQTLKSLPVSPVNTLGLRSLGNLLLLGGELEQSENLLKHSLEVAQKLQLPQDIAAAYLGLGKKAYALAIQNSKKPLYVTQLRQEALTAYQAAYNYGEPIQRLQATLNQLRLFVESGDKARAISLWQSHIPSFTELRPTRASVYAQLNFAQSLLKLAALEPHTNINAIEPILNLALEQAKALGDIQSQAYVLGSRGRFYELSKQWSLSKSVTTQALSLVSSNTAPHITYQLFWQLGRIYRLQGDLEKAKINYTQAINILGSLRNELVAIDTGVQFSFRESIEPVYRELVSLLLQTPDSREVSQESLKLARQVIESLQLAELDNFFQDACAEAKPKQIDQFDVNAAVFYPIILRDRLEVILSIPGEPLRHYGIKISQTELENMTQLTRISLRRTAFERERQPLVQKLYDWLIRPASASLAKNNIKTLVFVLDGALRNLPMATLHDGQQYLIEKYNIALAPGLQLLESRPLTKKELRVLLAGLSEAHQGLPPLPAVVSEVQQISSKLKAKILLNQQFTSKKLQEAIQKLPFPVLHLATHGQFSSNTEDTFILAWNDRINAKQLDRLLRSRKQGEQPIELFVLSACETAEGDNRAALGMAGVAIRSGARATVATLWQVNDLSTSILMTKFYQELTKPGMTKAEALRNAQLALLQMPNYQNPYFWASFVMIGNWL